MRLFIAINFGETMKDSLCRTMERLKAYTTGGNFTRRENLHMTLVFLGEIPPHRLSDIKEAMDRVEQSPFTFQLSGLGKFSRDGGDLYWIGVKKAEGLSEVYDQLFQVLSSAGFTLEKREYKPHLTLGRKIRVAEPFDAGEFSRQIPDLEVKVEAISLMKSEQINGKLTYTEVYGKSLQPEE